MTWNGRLPESYWRKHLFETFRASQSLARVTDDEIRELVENVMARSKEAVAKMRAE